MCLRRMARGGVIQVVQRRKVSSIGAREQHARESLRRADAVCIDFDSTLIMEEGIDELAETCGAGAAVKEWTTKAMEGGMKFEDALAARLELIRPSKMDVERCLRERPPQVSPGAADFVAALRGRGTKVHVVSGGFRAMIQPIADTLGVSSVFANTILWDDAGMYQGFDPTEPTARDHGKARVIDLLKQSLGYRTVVMIGDGATDAQARPPADAFIAYAGVVHRDQVQRLADWYVTDFNALINALASPSSSSSSNASHPPSIHCPPASPP